MTTGSVVLGCTGLLVFLFRRMLQKPLAVLVDTMRNVAGGDP